MNKLKLKPAPGYLLIKPLEKETKTAAGIYIPESAGEKPQMGMVMAVGDSIKREGVEEKSFAKVNDRVMYKKWGGNEVKIEGEEYLFVEFKDVIAVAEE